MAGEAGFADPDAPGKRFRMFRRGQRGGAADLNAVAAQAAAGIGKVDGRETAITGFQHLSRTRPHTIPAARAARGEKRIRFHCPRWP